MKRIVRACAPLLLAGTLASCLPFPLFEPVGADPHPPQVQLLGIGFQPIEPPPPPPPEPPAPPLPPTPTPAPVFLPPEGFVVHPNDTTQAKLIFRVRYSDLGGDVVHFIIRDRDSSFSATVVPTAPEDEDDTLAAPAFFAGTSGIVLLEDVAFTAKMQGPHRLELWAEDSHGSRSEKVAFTITVVL